MLIVGSAFAYQNLTETSVGLEQVTLGHVPVESFALLYIAQNQSYFAKNGLNITIADYSTGATAVQALNSGEIDIAGSSEYVVALNAVEQQNISIIASCGESKIVELIGRKDQGITAPSDLKDKTVATAKGTVAEFDLGRFLEANDMAISDIDLVYLPPSQFAAAIGNKSVDAVVSWQIYNEEVKMQLDDNYNVWPLQSDAPFFSVLSCRSDWLSSHQNIAIKFVTALSEAQDYLDSNPKLAKQIIINRFNYTEDYLESVWSRNNCALSLSQKLVNVMTEEAAWMINNGLTTQKIPPTIAQYIDYNALRAVKPEAVTIP